MKHVKTLSASTLKNSMKKGGNGIFACWAAANDRLLAYAREKGKKIEYHNLPLHKMQ